MGKVQLYYSTSIPRDVSVRKSVSKKVLLQKLFPGLLALFFLGVGVRLLCCSKSGITTFTKLIKQVLQPLTSEIKKSTCYQLFLFARCRDVNI